MTRMIDFKGYRFKKDIILLCVRWLIPFHQRIQRDTLVPNHWNRMMRTTHF
jgi:hypothetical protein